MTPLFVAIDPGVARGSPGAVAACRGDVLQVVDLPVSAGEVDEAALAHVLRALAELGLPEYARPDLTVVERQRSMPGQGVSTTGKIMQCYGACRGVVAALGWRREVVEPARWKRAMRCTRDKELSRRRASEEWPEHAHMWPNKRHHGRAEAALMARWAQMKGA